jgi:ATP-dependent helicase/nuclease subunit A
MGQLEKNMTPPNAAQNLAASPHTSAWVEASAGTGKTKVLTDRVLNLLLEGTLPERILCLTFTKAAAAEMANRIQQRLGRWATLSDEELIAELQTLGKIAIPSLLSKARGLFTIFIDAPQGIKIQTLHSFCQSLLKRFPLEAGISPHFKVLDDPTSKEILQAAQSQSFKNMSATTLETYFEALAPYLSPASLSDLLAEALSQRRALYHLLEKHPSVDAIVKTVWHFFELSPHTSLESLQEKFSSNSLLSSDILRELIPVLQIGTKTDQAMGEVLTTWMTRPEKRRELLEGYQSLFLTKDGSIRKNLLSKKAQEECSWAFEILEKEASSLQRLRESSNNLHVAKASEAFIRLTFDVLNAYQMLKESRSLLDYEDLILKASHLLQKAESAPWVLYKLDGGIDHILVDEAQDTNPDQWQVISTLAEEFFVGSSASPQERTLFVVGDSKQSIYSFQGADPSAFQKFKKRFASAAAHAEKSWTEIDLSVSFRSTNAILETVDRIFDLPTARFGVVNEAHTLKHHTHRQGHGGIVEVWPLLETIPEDPTSPWEPPLNQKHLQSPRTQLANYIAHYIQNWFLTKKMLPSQGRCIEPKDIMILVRRRDTFVEELLKSLKSLDIPVSGIDRICLTDQLAVMDLMALGDFLLLPTDDLTLATLLKSPFFDISEEELFEICYDRKAPSLWEELMVRHSEKESYARAYKSLQDLLQKADVLSPYEFFALVLTCYEGRQKLLKRLGAEAEDPIEEFLDLALRYEQSHIPSLQGFIAWVRLHEMEIKRNLEQSDQNQVRIMTVHGSKGLQAPIVFLPDTTQPPLARSSVVWGDEFFLWVPQSSMETSSIASLKRKDLNIQAQEYRRLLYVALTRAEDQLYIGGWSPKSGVEDDSWYGMVKQALEPIATSFEMPSLTDITFSTPGLRLETPQLSGVTTLVPEPDLLPPLPKEAPWLFKETLGEKLVTVINPSHFSEKNYGKRLDLTTTIDPALRGILIHRLLQHLPNLDPAHWESVAISFLQHQLPDLDLETLEDIVQAANTVLKLPACAPYFGPQSAAEVSIAGWIRKTQVRGQIDRLAVDHGNKTVYVLDYKTTPSVPGSYNDIPEAYTTQMKWYAHLLSKIYEGYKIECSLLWTHNGTLFKV